MNDVLRIVFAAFLVTLAGCGNGMASPDLGSDIECTRPSDCASKECCVGIRSTDQPGVDLTFTHCAPAPGGCPLSNYLEGIGTIACTSNADCAHLGDDAGAPFTCVGSYEGLSICETD
jgi:hypothetical protein